MKAFPLEFFRLLNVLIIPLWFGLIFMPGKRWVKIGLDLFFVFAAFLFTANLFYSFNPTWRLVMDPSLARVAGLLETPRGAFGAWTHFLIGDLFVGRWIASEGRNRDFPPTLLIPILILTLLFGPAGLLAFLVSRFVREKLRS